MIVWPRTTGATDRPSTVVDCRSMRPTAAASVLSSSRGAGLAVRFSIVMAVSTAIERVAQPMWTSTS